ncbi:MAG: LysR family transcriptional regulator [Pseudomonadota bacterium]
MELWSEMRTAMMVAKLGTVRAAADELGLHRATVSRHIDLLEGYLGTKLFLRHKNGYTATKDGQSLRSVAESANELIASFIEQTHVEKQDLDGDLTISGINRALEYISPWIRSFRDMYPGVTIRLIAETRLAQLEHGEADIAIRVGAKPGNLDYVLVPLREFHLGVFGHKSYFESRSIPTDCVELEQHNLIAQQFPDGTLDIVERFGLPASAASIVVNNPSIALKHVRAGDGLSVIAFIDAEDDPDLIEVLPSDPPLSVTVWIVTHVDAHRSSIVQKFVRHLKTEIPEAPS